MEAEIPRRKCGNSIMGCSHRPTARKCGKHISSVDTPVPKALHTDICGERMEYRLMSGLQMPDDRRRDDRAGKDSNPKIHMFDNHTYMKQPK